MHFRENSNSWTGLDKITGCSGQCVCVCGVCCGKRKPYSGRDWAVRHLIDYDSKCFVGTMYREGVTIGVWSWVVAGQRMGFKTGTEMDMFAPENRNCSAFQEAETQMPNLRKAQEAVPDASVKEFQFKHGNLIELGVSAGGQQPSGLQISIPLTNSMDSAAKLQHQLPPFPVTVRDVPCGLKNTKGRRPRMEDRDCVVPNSFALPLEFCKGEGRIPSALLWRLHRLLESDSSSPSPRSPLTRVCSSSVDSDVVMQKLGNISSMVDDGSEAEGCVRSVDMFTMGAVFDGHGGDAVSSKLQERMPELVREILTGKRAPTESNDDNGDDLMEDVVGEDDLPNKRRLLLFGNQVVDGDFAERASQVNGMGGDETFAKAKAKSKRLTLADVEDALKTAFETMDAELGQAARTVGSTGVVALVSSNHLVVANLGDSRAVLSRKNEAFRLTRDHKPDDEQEEERIRSRGGRVWEYNGMRLMGLLAMTRAFGDHCLQPYGLTPTPEVTIVSTSADDEFLILASDGLWDVISDEEACELARRCFQRAFERGAARDTAARVAASVLMRAALDKGSNDNITVLVMDLRP